MAELLKNVYSAEFISEFSDLVVKVYPVFNKQNFENKIFDKEWYDLELKERMSKITHVLHHFLPKKIKEALTIIDKLIDLLLIVNTEEVQGFKYMFLAEYVSSYGLADFDNSIKSIEKITQFTSCEFAIRYFIEKYPEKTMKQMKVWAYHSNYNVRRLASEGCRSRLPWGIRLKMFVKDPALILPILEVLKDDSSLYVRKSVANNFNDISKDHPDKVIEVFNRWNNTYNKNRHWVIKHGLRTLLKLGHKNALSIIGYSNHKNKVEISDFKLNKERVKLGDELNFSFKLTYQSDLKLRIEYVMHFLRQFGKHNPKVFHLKELNTTDDTSLIIGKKHSFKPISTRKYYKGEQFIELKINGEVMARKSFQLI